MPDVDAAVSYWNQHGTLDHPAHPEAVARFFDGLDLLEPGVVSCSRWRPQPTDGDEPVEVAMFGGWATNPEPENGRGEREGTGARMEGGLTTGAPAASTPHRTASGAHA